MIFNIGTFAKQAETVFGKKLMDFLKEEKDTFIRLETATRLNRPAVEGIAEELQIRFSKEFNSLNIDDLNRTKQMIGYLTKQVMDEKGYDLDKEDVKMINTDMFKTGASYKKRK